MEVKKLNIKILFDDEEVFDYGDCRTCDRDDDHLTIREAKRFLEREDDKISGNDKFVEYKELYYNG